MPRYKMYRIKDAPRESFRWAAHTGGLAVVKMKDYDPADEIEAASPYSAWKNLAAQGEPLRMGDLLDEAPSPSGAARLYIAKYIGFEPAEWFVPEPKQESPVSVCSSSESAEGDSVSHR
ncbi:MAG: hypothetical protein JO270_13380 [Acidobacteriaceae bacterium]|nr:hypothetical protein [Acidobacteriaceae bacterium]